MIRRPPRSPLFPYPTLSRSGGASRPMVVAEAEAAAEGVLRLRLKAADGHALPRWTPGSHIDLQCGDTGLSRQYSLCGDPQDTDRKSTRLNSSHQIISYAVFC